MTYPNIQTEDAEKYRCESCGNFNIVIDRLRDLEKFKYPNGKEILLCHYCATRETERLAYKAGEEIAQETKELPQNYQQSYLEKFNNHRRSIIEETSGFGESQLRDYARDVLMSELTSLREVITNARIKADAIVSAWNELGSKLREEYRKEIQLKDLTYKPEPVKPPRSQKAVPQETALQAIIKSMKAIGMELSEEQAKEMLMTGKIKDRENRK